MIRSILMGAVAGMRAMTPLAAVANAARTRQLPRDTGAPVLLALPIVSAATLAIAAGELAGDKMKSAPDRIVPAGMAARLVTGAVAGAALAPRRQRTAAALAGAGAALIAAHLTWRARKAAIERFGQTATGVIEDAVTLAAATAIIRSGQSR